MVLVSGQPRRALRRVATPPATNAADAATHCAEDGTNVLFKLHRGAALRAHDIGAHCTPAAEFSRLGYVACCQRCAATEERLRHAADVRFPESGRAARYGSGRAGHGEPRGARCERRHRTTRGTPARRPRSYSAARTGPWGAARTSARAAARELAKRGQTFAVTPPLPPRRKRPRAELNHDGRRRTNRWGRGRSPRVRRR